LRLLFWGFLIWEWIHKRDLQHRYDLTKLDQSVILPNVNSKLPQNRRSTPKVLGPLLLLGLLLGGLWLAEFHRFGPASNAAPPAQETKPLPSEQPSLANLTHLNIPPPPREVNEAFAKKALPSPILPFTRGQNGERRYHAPKTVLLPLSALEAAPVSFALTPLDDRVHLLPSEWDLHTKTARRMVLDVAALQSVVAGETAHLLAPLPDGSALKLIIHSIKSRAGMTHTLQGEVAGEPQSSVVQLVLHDGIIHGTISRYSQDQHLEYRILASGHLVVRELDNASLSDVCGDPGREADSVAAATEPPAPTTNAQEDPAEDTPGYVTIDIVVGYDRGARQADGGQAQIEARIIASVDRMTMAFANSQITATELMLLGTIEDPDYVFPGRTAGTMAGSDELGDLNNTSPSNPQLNTVSDYANALGADLKAFIVMQADGSAGVAYRPGTSSITARDYMTSNRITFAHELAHNIGARHSWGDTSGTDAEVNVHSYGWRLAPEGQPRVRTIMAYDWAWGSGTRIPYFANPNVLYQGARTGQVNGYNATGDALSDPRYVSGGLIGGLGAGFNGSRVNLGARNAHFIHAEAPSRANLQVRNFFELLTPVTAATFAPGDSVSITWAGGDHTGTVSIGLFKGRVLQSSITTGLAALARKHTWNIPSAIASGSDYFLRLTLNNGLTADSGLFNIYGSGLTISPPMELISTGEPGGPFAPESITYQLTNPGHPTFSWTASVNAPWVSLSQEQGTLAPDESTPLIVAINETAANLPAGVHRATLTITDSSTGNEHQKSITIQAIGRPQIRLEHPIGTPLNHTAATLDFGEVFRSAQASRRLTIRNTGAVDLLLGTPQLSGPQAAAFSLLPFSSTSIPPGSSASLSVVFSPAAQVAHEATLQISSNDSLATSIQIQLTGIGDQLSNSVQLVSDIHSSPPRISPNSSLSMGSYTLITVFTPEHGNELWRTDGTDAGTYLLADINTGAASSDVTHLTRVGELAYFAANSPPTGVELWVTDGTPGGTRMIRDINLGVGSSNPRSFCKLGSDVYFTATTTATGFELWKTDGTAAGTMMVVDLWPGLNSSNPNFLTAFSGELYFAANSTSHGIELYKSDGTAAGTVLVKDIQPGINGSQPSLFTALGDTLFFAATSSLGRELWKTDGTESGTVLVRDLLSGSANGNPSDLVNFNDTLYFRAATISSGTELWRSDGTTDGTVRVTTLNLGSQLSLSGSLVVFNERLYFSAISALHGAELWSSDGTADGTVLVHDINPGNFSSSPRQLRMANGLLFFTASNSQGTELWRTDGTAAGTTITRDIRLGNLSSFPNFLSSVGSFLVFSSDDGQGSSLWRSDGSLGGTVPVTDRLFGSSSSNPTNIANLNGNLIFAATTAAFGTEPWISAGTHLSTRLLTDLSFGTTSSNPNHFTWNGDQFFFAATNEVSGNELYEGAMSFTPPGPLRAFMSGMKFSTPSNFLRVGNQVFFVANSTSWGQELYRTDGTSAGTYLVRDIHQGNQGTASAFPAHFINYKNILYFQATNETFGTELWRSDGTNNGTWLVKDIHVGTANSNPAHFAVMDGLLYFSAASAGEGSELWRTDGSNEGTVLVASISPGSSGSSPNQLTPVNGTLFFTAAGPEGREIWQSDGTPQGTQLVKDIRPGLASSNPTDLTAVAGVLFFSANDGLSGQELWRSDGTAEGTERVVDINPGSANANPTNLVNMGGILYFTAEDGNHGVELWQSNGTSSGTLMAADILPGLNGSNPQSLTAVGANLYFSANAPGIGRELFRVERPIPQQLVVSHPAGVQLASNESHIAFAQTLLGDTASRHFTLENLGTIPLDLTSIEIVGPDAVHFTVQAITETRLFGNTKGHFELVFRPLSFGPKTAFLTLHSNDPNQAAFTVPLSGKGGLPPEIQWESPANIPLPLLNASLDFGQLSLGQAPTSQNLILRNLVSNSGLQINSVFLTGPNAADFELDRSAFLSTISANDQSVLTLRFRPLGKGLRQAQLTVLSNAVNGGTISLTLSGSAVAAPGPSQFIVGPTELPMRFTEDGPFSLPFASTSGEPVTIEIVNGAGSISGNIFTPPQEGGAITFRISQAGNSLYAKAQSIYRTLLVGSGKFVTLGRGATAEHCVGIKSDGTLWAWGANTSGQCGLGHQLPVTQPTQVGHDTDWAQVVLGSHSTLALKTDGSLWAWGTNFSGQLGIGLAHHAHSPTPVSVGTTWKTIAAGAIHALAIRSDDTLWAWGSNSHFQCGTSQSTSSLHRTPTQVCTTKWRAISAGDHHSLGIRIDGTLWSWGSNSNGQSGMGASSGSFTMNQIGFESDWTSIAAGKEHSLATRGFGTLWATGDNTHHQLGLGNQSNRRSFSQVGSSTTWTEVEAGGNHSMARQHDGTLWVWGQNDHGQLGLGNTEPTSVPIRLPQTSRWTKVAASAFHSLAVKEDGSLWVAGRNTKGLIGIPIHHPYQITSGSPLSPTLGLSRTQFLRSDGSLWAVGTVPLGNGKASSTFYSPTQIGSESDWTSLAGGNHQILGLRRPGTLWAWGQNANGTFGSDPLLEQATLNQIGVETDWHQFATDDDFFAAIKTDGSLWTWGINESGQLGHGNTLPSPIPKQVGTHTDWRFITCVEGACFAIKTNGTLWSWGANSRSRLGLGQTGIHPSPTRVGIASDWRTVAAGSNHTLAIKNDGTLWAVGLNSDNQLGILHLFSTGTFMQVGTDTDWVQAAAFETHSMALKADGSLWAWGLNQNGELGNGNLIDAPIPTRVGNTTAWKALAQGNSRANTSLALSEDGSLWGFGGNADGQLTDGVPISSHFTSVYPASHPQEITANPLFVPARQVPVPLQATSSSGLPIDYIVVGPASLDAAKAQLTVTGTGPVKLFAWQRGSAPTWRNSALIQIPVYQTPIITTPPVSQRVSQFDPVTFSVKVDSGLVTSYQWRRNGQPIPEASDSTFTLTSAQKADAGAYDVIITNEIGSIISPAASLVVATSTPIIIKPPSPTIGLTGESSQFTVVAIGTPPLSYQWRRNGRPIHGATSPTLTLPSVELSDRANYSVSVSAVKTVTSSAATLTVVSALDGSLNIEDGRNALIRVTDIGPVSNRYWTFNGTPLAETNRIKPSRDGKTLVIKNVNLSDAGLYRCVVSYRNETVTSGATELIIHNSPPFLVIPQRMPNGIVSGFYTHSITTQDSPTNRPNRFHASGLPLGLTCNPITGIIQGYPRRAGSFTVTVTAANARGSRSTSERITIAAMPTQLAGQYTGIIERHASLNQLLGGKLDFSITSTGNYSGRISLGTSNWPFKGQLNVDPVGLLPPYANTTIPRRNLPPLLLALTVPFSANSTWSGSISEGNVSAAIHGWRHSWNRHHPALPYAGFYTYGLDYAAEHASDGPSIRPFGHGFGTLSISPRGSYRLGGRMADGSNLTQAGFLGGQGQLGFFALLYGRSFAGSFTGLASVNRGDDLERAIDNSLTGHPTWSRPPGPTKVSLYPGGFAPLTLPLSGGFFTPTPTPLSATPDALNTSLSFHSASLEVSATNPNRLLGFNAKGRLLTSPASAHPTTFNYQSRTGLFSGHFLLSDPHWEKPEPATWQRKVRYQGVTISRSAESLHPVGSGYFLLPQLPILNPKSNPPPILSGKVRLELADD